MSYDCPHGGDPNACPPCQRPPQGKKRPPKITSESARVGARTNARFKSQCPECLGLIRLDDPIVMTDVGWVHEESCADG